MAEHTPHHQEDSILEVEVKLSSPVTPSKSHRIAEKRAFTSSGHLGLFLAKIKSLPKRLLEARVGGTLVTAWISLVVGLLTVATIGPGFKRLGQMGVSVSLRPCWRSQVCLLILAGPTFIELKREDPAKRMQLLKRENLLLFLGCSLTWSTTMMLWLKSLEYTSIARASLLTNSYPIILVVWYKIRKVPISVGEVVGTLIGFGGVAITLVGSVGGGIRVEELLGDGLCLLVATLNSANVLWGSKLRQTADLFTYTFFNTLILTLVTAVVSFAGEGAVVSFHGANGIFGWIDPEFLGLVVFVAVAVGVVGVVAYNYALKQVPPLAYSVFKLLDPPFTGILAVFLGLDSIPSIWTFVGGAVTISGIFVVQHALQKRVKAENQLKYNRMDDDEGHHAPQVELEDIHHEEPRQAEPEPPLPRMDPEKPSVSEPKNGEVA